MKCKDKKIYLIIRGGRLLTNQLLLTHRTVVRIDRGSGKTKYIFVVVDRYPFED